MQLEYDQPNKEFVITKPNGSKHKQQLKTLDKYKVKIDVKKFTNGTIYKPVAIPDSYERSIRKSQD